jgi:NitT/TauT family transport system substrate-binding protein
MRGCITGLAVALLGMATPAEAEVNTLHIGVQYGTSMVPMMVMEHDRLLEKQAEAAGLGEVAVTYSNFSNPTPMSDGVISGALDLGIVGAPALLQLWDKTRNGSNPIRGLASVSANPSTLVTRNPAVHTIKDFTERDRIALPGVKIGLNAIILQMAAADAWGPGEWARLDARTTTLGHPDALAAMLSGGMAAGGGDITAHFSQPPFSTMEIKAGMRPILRAKDVLGDGWDMILFGTTRFHDRNPKLIAALLAALNQADAAIRANPRVAAETYLAISGDKKSSIDDIVALITDPDTAYDVKPRSVMRFAVFMHGIGALKNKPNDWTDIFFPDIKP